MPCMSAMEDPANFCSSACFEALVPWIDQCYGLIDPGIQAVFNPILNMMERCPDPPSRDEDDDAPCCQTCQDGCGGYMSATGDYGAGRIAPECLDARHTRTVRGETMGVCDSDGEVLNSTISVSLLSAEATLIPMGRSEKLCCRAPLLRECVFSCVITVQTPFDGEPCRRDCDQACEAIGGIERVLIGCDSGFPDDDASFDEICANSACLLHLFLPVGLDLLIVLLTAVHLRLCPEPHHL